MKRGWKWVGLGILAALLIAVACVRDRGSSGDPEEVELRSYTVPEGFDRAEWRDMLRGALALGDRKIGGVRVGPGNTLVVTAPRGVQAGIAELLKELESRGPVARPGPGSVSVNYWVLVGRPLASGDPGSPVRIGSGRRNILEKLSPVMDQIASAQGPMEFHLLEQLRLTSIDDSREAEMRGRYVQLSQRVMKDDSGQRLADISISMSAHNLESRVKIEPGKFVILGQTALNVNGGVVPSGLDQADDLMLYYVISADTD